MFSEESGCSELHMGVSKNQGPLRNPNSRALIKRTPTKRSPNLWKQPNVSESRVMVA